LPESVLRMYRRKLKSESLIVNSFAYVGLLSGLALFLGLVAVNVLYMNRELWFFLIATVVFLVSSRVFAGILGGIIGDELAYKIANKHLAEDWANHIAEREAKLCE